ncbi:MAG TPA: hypothetical protein VGD73_27900 [Pseudonocardia sp.]
MRNTPLCQDTAEHHADLGGQPARLGHRRLAPIGGHRGVAPALSLMLGGG